MVQVSIAEVQHILWGTYKTCTSLSHTTLITNSTGEAVLQETSTVESETGPTWISASPVHHDVILVAAQSSLNLYHYSLSDSGDISWTRKRKIEMQGWSRIVHASFSNDGKYLLAVDYDAGQAKSVRVKMSDDDESRLCSTVTYRGTGGYPPLQSASHPHQIRQHPAQPWIYVCDLGTDEIHLHHLSATGQLQFITSFSAPSGTGPRHLAFHPSHKVLYLLGEISSTVMTFSIDDDTGELSYVATSSILPPEIADRATAGQNLLDGSRGLMASELLVPSSGKHIYALNRNQQNVTSDQLATMDLDIEYPYLPLEGSIRFTPTLGLVSRGMQLEPTSERLLAVANQGTPSITIFKREPDTGDLATLAHLRPPSGNPVTAAQWLPKEI
ncbi:hypothetical protein V866_000672 [Kwoniella sp. B9012]